MGCCLSTTSPTKSPDEDVSTSKLPDSDVKGGTKPPGLVLDEEETVKQVLSQTQTQTPNISVVKETIKEEEQEEISVVSEMYSISGSFSTTTFNDGEEGGEVNQRILTHHSPAKKCFNNSRVNARAKYGGLRSLESSNSREITPGHRSPGPSSQVQSRPRPPQGRTAIVQRRNVGRRDRDWQGLGSPAAVSEVIRHQRTAVTGHPGERSRLRKLEESKKIENHDGAVSRESLDNPRVSLECFIFL